MVSNSTKSATSAFGDKREQLLRAAARCFNEKGYSGTSLKDVSAHLGLTDAAIYYYIDGKQQLVYECYRRAADIGRAALDDAIANGGSGLDIARDYVRRHVDAHCGSAGPIAIMSEIPSLRDDDREHILALSREHSARFEQVLERGIEDGSILACDVRMTGNAIMGAINWIPKWFHGDDAVAQRVAATFPDYLTRGLGA
ncbi:MAG: TetR/AcrR family transcriptional regulator [Pseudomonadota bacterium]